MDFSPFDARGYPQVTVPDGYTEWADTYDRIVRDEMDLRLLSRLATVEWRSIHRAVDLACGTGRVGVWLRAQGVLRLDGIDVTARMLDGARARGVYEDVREGDLRQTPFASGAYELVTASLVDEHLPRLGPMYAEAMRLLAAGGIFVIAGYHPQFLMTVGMPTHFHRADGEPVAIETFVHLLSDHVAAARSQGLELLEMHEGLVDDEYIASKSKWEKYRGAPVSFAFAWRG